MSVTPTGGGKDATLPISGSKRLSGTHAGGSESAERHDNRGPACPVRTTRESWIRLS